MNRCFVILCVIMLSGFLCATGSAETAKYASTQRFLDAMDAQGIEYELLGLNEDNEEKVSIKYDGENMEVIEVTAYFDADNEHCDMLVRHFLEFEPQAQADVARACDQANYDYRIVTFFTYDSAVYAEYDLRLPEDKGGEICTEVVNMVAMATDRVFPSLVSAAGYSAGTGDGSATNTPDPGTSDRNSLLDGIEGKLGSTVGDVRRVLSTLIGSEEPADNGFIARLFGSDVSPQVGAQVDAMLGNDSTQTPEADSSSTDLYINRLIESGLLS